MYDPERFDIALELAFPSSGAPGNTLVRIHLQCVLEHLEMLPRIAFEAEMMISQALYEKHKRTRENERRMEILLTQRDRRRGL